MCTREEIEDFHQFALQQLEGDASNLNIQDLAGLWQTRNIPAAEFAESVAAVKSALQDMRQGDQEQPAEEVIAELRMI
ncbi:MAG: hypothetical protein P8M30_11225 [Planctomycetaceae bacterium]|jgi:hypothetical protein|nr:hypothetical protein [Planctomycetaceae bacterium]